MDWHKWAASAAALVAIIGGFAQLTAGEKSIPQVQVTGDAWSMEFPTETEPRPQFKGYWAIRIANNSSMQAEKFQLKPEQQAFYEFQVDQGPKKTGIVNGPLEIGTLLPGSVAEVQMWTSEAPAERPRLRFAHKNDFGDVSFTPPTETDSGDSGVLVVFCILSIGFGVLMIKVNRDVMKVADSVIKERDKLYKGVDVVAEMIATTEFEEEVFRATPRELALAMKVTEETVLAAVRLLELRGIIADVATSAEGYLTFRRTCVPWSYPSTCDDEAA